MADPYHLVHRATTWKDNTTELDKIMADMSTLSKSQVSVVSEAARALLSAGRLNEYRSAKCHVYAARGYTMYDRVQAIGSIGKACGHLETLRKDSKPLAALGVKEEHPQVRDLAAEIEELKR
jgi:hypothetical protein